MSPLAENPAPSQMLLDTAHPIFEQLRQKGISARETKIPDNPMSGVLFEPLSDSENKRPVANANLLSIGGFSSTLKTTVHMNAAFHERLAGEVDATLGLSGNFTNDTLNERPYDSSPIVQATYIADMYTTSFPIVEGVSPKHIKMLAYSMGGGLEPIVAKILMERGYVVDEIVMIATPGMEKVLPTTTLARFGSIAFKQENDLKFLYPSPLDVRQEKVRDKNENKDRLSYLQRQENEASHNLILERFQNPDNLLTQSLTPDELAKVKDIDSIMNKFFALGKTTDGSAESLHPLREQIIKLQAERTAILKKAIVERILGGQPYNQDLGTPTNPNTMRNQLATLATGDAFEIARQLSSESTTQNIQNLVDYMHDVGITAPLDITCIGGTNDPLVNSKERALGQVEEQKIGPTPKDAEAQYFGYNARKERSSNLPSIKYTELAIEGQGHLTLPLDSNQIAETVVRTFKRHTKRNQQFVDRLPIAA